MNSSPFRVHCKDSPEIASPAGHYSHVSVGAGQVFISGQLPVDCRGVPLSKASFREQVELTLRNLDACLRVVGAVREDLLQVRIYVTDISKWPVFNELYAQWIGHHRPARAVAGVSELHYGVAVEIEAIAVNAPRGS